MDLPLELIAAILDYVVDDMVGSGITDVLQVNTFFYNIAGQSLYSNLTFHSAHQLQRFASQDSPVRWKPRTIHVILSGETAEFDIFRHLAGALRRCGARPLDPVTFERGEQLPLRRLTLCMHSHSCNPNSRDVYAALTLVNPRNFGWKGPDPQHHFSIAIVPTATYHLLKAIGTWTAIEHIVLTNLSFPPDYIGIPVPLSPPKPLLPSLPSLRTLYLGQATLVNPNTIAAMICLSGQESLESVRLVDAYRESIWGPRIRRSDLERAALSFEIDMPPDSRVTRIRRIVKCEGLTERIIGGDRVEGLTSLD